MSELPSMPIVEPPNPPPLLELPPAPPLDWGFGEPPLPAEPPSRGCCLPETQVPICLEQVKPSGQFLSSAHFTFVGSAL